MSQSAWMEQADSDLAAAALLSENNLHSQAIWFAAQAVEKGHKAILAALGLRYEDKHFKHLGHGTGGIAKILPEVLHEPIDPEIGRMLASLESRAETSRYPVLKPTDTGTARIVAPARSITTSRQDVDEARTLLAWCRDRVARAVNAVGAMRP